MTLSESKVKVFAKGTIADGYFGDRAKVDFALVGNSIVTISDCGCFRSGCPDVVDVAEAVHTLMTHPSAKDITVTSIKGI